MKNEHVPSSSFNIYNNKNLNFRTIPDYIVIVIVYAYISVQKESTLEFILYTIQFVYNIHNTKHIHSNICLVVC